MNEDYSDRRKPNRPRVSIGALTVVVRVPGRPGEVRAFTEDERSDAERYAAGTGGVVEKLN